MTKTIDLPLYDVTGNLTPLVVAAMTETGATSAHHRPIAAGENIDKIVARVAGVEGLDRSKAANPSARSRSTARNE